MLFDVYELPGLLVALIDRVRKFGKADIDIDLAAGLAGDGEPLAAPSNFLVHLLALVTKSPKLLEAERDHTCISMAPCSEETKSYYQRYCRVELTDDGKFTGDLSDG